MYAPFSWGTGVNEQGAFIWHGLPEGPCLSEILFAITAGSDTTASTIRCTMLYLMSTPRVYNKLKMVVSEAISKGVISIPIKLEEAKAIPYLQVRRANAL